MTLQQYIQNKSVLFITVKNQDYIRTTQMQRYMQQYAANVQLVTSEAPDPIRRMLDLQRRIPQLAEEIRDVDIVILGFLPQLLWKRVRAIRGNRAMGAEFFLSLYDTIVLDRHYLKPANPVAKLLHRMDERVIADADIIVTDTRADADFFTEEFGRTQHATATVTKSDGQPDDKYDVMYLEADTTIYTQNLSSDAPNCNKPYKVLYFGTGLPLQGIDIVADAYKRLTAESGIETIYIGGMPDKLLRELDGVPNFTYHKWLTQEQLAQEIASADLCLAGHFNGNIGKAARTIPGKAYIYEALDRDIILGDSPANHELFTQDDHHHFVTRGDGQALQQAILKQYRQNHKLDSEEQ